MDENHTIYVREVAPLQNVLSDKMNHLSKLYFSHLLPQTIGLTDF